LAAPFFSVTGLLMLAASANLLAAAVALATLISYVVIYTPLKTRPRSSFATVIGAIPGALPPVIGWAASRGALSSEAWVLFGIMFLWQLPHFLAIAWIFRDDYARAGFPMLSVIEPDGSSTGRQSIVYAAALVPLSLAPTLIGLLPAVCISPVRCCSAWRFSIWPFRFARSRTVADRADAVLWNRSSTLPVLWIVIDRQQALGR
jgi:protoheme IX farnesyltransferase